MPELPEVEVVRRGLARHVVGRRLESVEVLHPRPVRRHVGGAEDFCAVLRGRVVTDARRRGKFLWLPLDNGDALVAHLGMSGQMLVQPASAADERHLRVRLRLGGPEARERLGGPEARERLGGPEARERLGGPEARELRFVDQRMFGGLAVSPGGAQLPAEVAHIALDPFDPLFDDAGFTAQVRRRTAAIKRLLLDQCLISGVGNIYADEALWAARLHAQRSGGGLSARQVHSLLAEVRAVMGAALEQGGTSFDSLYVNVNGESGYFDRSLSVYGREALPCRRCSTPIRRVAFTNRSSFFCPRCQPAPRRPR